MSHPIGPQIKIAMAREVVAVIDDLAVNAGLTRSEWVRQAVAGAMPPGVYNTLTGTNRTPTAHRP